MIKLTVKNLNGFDKTKGLINAKKQYPVYFLTRWGIHTFGVKYPIDVIILDKNNKIAKIHEKLKPNKVFFWNPKFNRVIELPSGSVKKYMFKNNQRLSIIFTA